MVMLMLVLMIVLVIVLVVLALVLTDVLMAAGVVVMEQWQQWCQRCSWLWSCQW